MESERVIVIADDEEMVRSFLKEVFSKMGCRVLEAGSAGEVLDIVNREGRRVALVMLDAVMPGKGGVEVIPQVREKAPQAMVVLFSGNPGPYRDRALALGAHDVVEKPFRMGVLISLVEKAFNQEGSPRKAPAKAL